LNCVNLNINKIEFVSKDETSEIIEGTIVIDEDFEQGKIQFPVALQVILIELFISYAQSISVFQSGEGQLTLVFDGTIDEQLHGFYRTKDQNQIGACTQFEVITLFIDLLVDRFVSFSPVTRVTHFRVSMSRV
jgi:hypothetical protein